MNKKKLNYAVLGFFVVIGLALFVIAIFLIGNRNNMFSKTISARAIFNNVTGLMDGSKVTFNGISVGTIKYINILPDGHIELLMEIKKSEVKFIKKDSKVMLISEGLVGNKVIQISAGSMESPPIDDGDLMQSVEPISMETIMDNLNNVSINADKLTNEIFEISAKVNRGDGTLGQLLNNTSLYYKIDSILYSLNNFSYRLNLIGGTVGTMVDKMSYKLDTLAYAINVITQNISEISTKINSSQSLVGTLFTDTTFANNIKQSVENIKTTTSNLEQGALSLSQNMEALKHNFLFKGYFEDIGYWDKPDFEKKTPNKFYEDNQRKLDSLSKQIDDLKKLIEKK